MTVLLLPPGKDILTTTCEAVVIPTNCVGTQGAGLAKLAAQRWARWSRGYWLWCRDNQPSPGDVCLAELEERPAGHRWVVAVATKNHWRDPSELPWIEAGLLELERAVATEPTLTSLAIPALGCGVATGQLAWNDVRPLVLATAERLSARGLRVEVYEPWGEAASSRRRQPVQRSSS